MPKSKSRKKSKSSPAPEARVKKGISKQRMITLAVGAGIVVAGGLVVERDPEGGKPVF